MTYYKNTDNVSAAHIITNCDRVSVLQFAIGGFGDRYFKTRQLLLQILTPTYAMRFDCCSGLYKCQLLRGNYSRTPLFRTRLIRSPRYFELFVLSLHLKSTPLFRNCQKKSTRRNFQATNKLKSEVRQTIETLTLQFVCCWGSRDSRANKPVVIHDRQKY